MKINTISFDEACQKINAFAVKQQTTTRVFLYQSLGCILAEDIYASFDMPQQRLAAMDGYVLSTSTIQQKLLETQEEDIIFDINPLPLCADKEESTSFNPHKATKIFTGAKIPHNADILIIIEYVTHIQQCIKINRHILQTSLHSKSPIREIGENFKNGDLLLRKGEKIQAAEIGLLASLNRLFVLVYSPPKTAIICGGNELIDLGEPSQTSFEIRSINNHLLYALVKENGGIPLSYPLLNDNKNDILEVFYDALSKADIIIFSGGMSIGDFDLIPHLLQNEADRVFFYGVKIKPGKPSAFACKNHKPIVGLAGFPNATYVGFHYFVRPLLAKLSGSSIRPFFLQATLQETISKDDKRTEFRSCLLSLKHGKLLASIDSSKTFHSAAINHLCGQNAFVVLKEEQHIFNAGENVPVALLSGFKSLEMDI